MLPTFEINATNIKSALTFQRKIIMKTIRLLSGGIAFLAFIVTVSCKNSKSNPFSKNYEVIEKVGAPRVLQGERVLSGDTLLAVGEVFAIGDTLINFTPENKDAVVTVYDKHGITIGSFGKGGRASNEFTDGAGLTGQMENGCFWVNDVNKAQLFSVNLKASVDSASCVLAKQTFTAGRVINAFYMNESEILYEQETADSYRLHLYNSTQKRDVWKEDLYTSCGGDAFSFYKSHMALSADGKHLAAAMSKMNQINFFSLNDKKRKAVSLYVPSKLCEDADEAPCYYCAVAGSKDFVYALYMNQSADDSYETPKPMQIHVFDWNGNFQKILQVNEYVVRFTVDEHGQYLYGVVLPDYNIYRYSLL